MSTPYLAKLSSELEKTIGVYASCTCEAVIWVTGQVTFPATSRTLPLAWNTSSQTTSGALFSWATRPDVRIVRDIWQHPAWKDADLLVLYCKDDQYIPPSVDKEVMVHTWERLHQITQQTCPGVFKLLPLVNHEITNERLHHTPCSWADLIKCQGREKWFRWLQYFWARCLYRSYYYNSVSEVPSINHAKPL